MREIKFKALMYLGKYVDANLLGNGIYVCSKPFLYNKEETIETLINQARLVQDMISGSFFSEDYFDNLRKCQLVELVLVIVNK